MAKKLSGTKQVGRRSRTRAARKGFGEEKVVVPEQASTSPAHRTGTPTNPVAKPAASEKPEVEKTPATPSSKPAIEAISNSGVKGKTTQPAATEKAKAVPAGPGTGKLVQTKTQATKSTRTAPESAAQPARKTEPAITPETASPPATSKPTPAVPAELQTAPAWPQKVHLEEGVPSAEAAPLPSEETSDALAEVESIHVEEPLPEVASEPHDEPSPYVYHGPSLYIVHITPEMAPVAKVGGLADVVFGLSRELAIRGNQVEIILPKYDTLRYDHIYKLHPVYNDLWVPWYDGAIHCTVYFGFVHERQCFFIEPHSRDNFFNRSSIYGFHDDLIRYAFFSRAALEFMFKAGKHPDIAHCHDWQTALVPVLLYEIYQHLGMTHPRVCLTIHNFKHQGIAGTEMLRATGLHQPERFFDYHRLRDNYNPHALNLLKGGIVYANFITTVSPRYAFETRDGGQGFGLETTLHTHHMKYGGVVNGIDYDVWNPEIDWHIPVRYNPDSIDGKYDNKRALRHRLLLADNEKPIVAFIGRLDTQKGLELVRHAIFYALERGAQFVLLGASPDHAINADFWGLKRMLNDSPDCHLEIGFDEELSHLIYAGADMILVPSRFEPCGLTQLIALRYATIPIVRAVGGLADTVFDKDHAYQPLHERNGYVFEHYDPAGLESALGRAIACYYHHPDHFRELMKNAIRSDYSWNRPGWDYLNIYNYIRNK